MSWIEFGVVTLKICCGNSALSYQEISWTCHDIEDAMSWIDYGVSILPQYYLNLVSRHCYLMSRHCIFSSIVSADVATLVTCCRDTELIL